MGEDFKFANCIVLLLATIAIVLYTNVPYALLDHNPPEGMVFSSISTNVPDVSSYMMWIRQHAQGKLLVHNHMTVDQHPGMLPNPAWLLAGGFKALFDSSTMFAYHAIRILLSFTYLILLYVLLLKVLHRRRDAWTAWILTSAGGGLGWLEFLGARVPSADWMTELWSWPSMMHYPHFILALILAIVFFLLSIKAFEMRSRARAIAAGLVLTLLAFVHPYTAGTILVAATVLQLFSIWRNQGRPDGAARTRTLFWWIFAAALPGFVAVAIQAMTNPMVAAWAAQNQMPSPPPWEYALGFGLIGVAAVLFIVKLLRRSTRPDLPVLFAVFWIGTALILAYADPIVPFARRCMEGVHIAVVFLAVRFIYELKFKSARIAVAAALLVTALPTPLMHIRHEVTKENPGYVAEDMDRMIDAVRNWVKDGNVLSDPRTSLFIAGDTDASVFVAHHEVTPGFVDKMDRIYRFMTTSTTLSERLELMNRIGCPWVVATPYVAYRLLDPTGMDQQTAAPVREYARGNSWILLGPVEPPKTGQKIFTTSEPLK